MIIRTKHNGYVNGNNRLYPGGGGGPTTTTSYQTNIPEYMEGYVHKMMGATEGQIYQGDGFREYKPYGEYDKSRGGSGESVAGFTPMQAGAMRGLQNYQLPQQGQYGSQMVGMSGLGAMGAGQQYAQQATNPGSVQAYMSPYMEGAVAPELREAARQSAMMGQQNQAKAVQQGAFGGSGSTFVEAERQRNLARQQGDIYGKGMQNAFQSAQQAQQFGADLNLKGLGMGMEGGKTLADIGNQQYAQETGLMQQQLGVGKTQQDYEQARLNQIIQDYATKQQYPFMQLGMLSNMIRGQPMQAVTTQSYQAQPSMLQQGIGALGMYNTMQGKPAKEGGIIKMANGGITNPYKLSGMAKKLSDEQLADQEKNDPMGVMEAEGQRRKEIRGMASGGILAFAKGDEVKQDIVDNPSASNKGVLTPEPEVKEVKGKKVSKKTESAAGESPEFKQIMHEVGPALAARKVPSAEEATLQKSLATEQAKKPGDYLEEIKATREAAGIDPQFFEKARSPLQQQLADLTSKSEDKKRYREAQAWAIFGSTPGPILATGLKAFGGYLEQTIKDEEDLAEAKAKLNEALFDINKSDYLNKSGMADKAAELKLNAFKTVTDLSYKVATIKEKRAEDELSTVGGAAKEALKSRTDIQQERIRAAAAAGKGTAGADIKERKLTLEQNKEINDALAEYDKNNLKQKEKIERTLLTLPKDSKYRDGYTEQLEKIETGRQELKRRLEMQMGREVAPAAASDKPAAVGLVPGAVVDGYKFKGGNPNDKNNWNKI